MTTFFHVSLVLGFQNYARNSYPSIAFWAMYFQKCIANPAHLAGLFCPVLFCPQKAIAVGIKFLAHFCYPLIKKTWKIFSKVGMVFCYYNCSDLLWEKIVPVIEKFFWNSRPSASNLQNFWDHLNNLFKQWKVRTISGHRMIFLTCSWRFLRSNKSEQLWFKSEKIIGI